VLISPQGETCIANLLSVISEEKENLLSQKDKIDMTKCDSKLTAQNSPQRNKIKNFDAE